MNALNLAEIASRLATPDAHVDGVAGICIGGQHRPY
jgi:hypothetical protein